MFFAAGPPSTPWRPPEQVVGEITSWLNFLLYVGLTVSVVATIVFGAMWALDKDRGEPVSATAPTVRALRIAIGVLMMTSATTLARWFF